MEQSKTLAVSVSAKEFVTYQCSQCGHCCRRIEGCVMVESLDAYRMAKHLREQHCGVRSTDDVLLQYCEPTPLTDEGYPIYTLKTVGAEASCVFCRATIAASMPPVLEPAAFIHFRRGPVSAAGILNTASALTTISSTIQRRKGFRQRLVLSQFPQNGERVFETGICRYHGNR